MILVLFTVCYGLLPFLLLLLWKKKSGTNALIFYPFTLFVFVASLYELIGSVVLQIKVVHWFTLYNLLVFIVLFHFFYKLLKGHYKKIFVLFMLLFVANIIYVSQHFVINDYLQFIPYFKGLQTIFILTFSILWFKDSFKNLNSPSLFDEPAFYLLSGLIIYYCGTFFLFLLGDILYVNNEKAFHDNWIINVVLNIILRTLLIITLWKERLSKIENVHAKFKI